MVASTQQYRPDNYPTVPIPPLDLTIRRIRAAVPPHCFKRNLLTSLRHLALDLLMVSALALLINYIDRNAPTQALLRTLVTVIAWPTYWWWQGAVMTGVWVLAHECGHQAFSPYKSVNDAIGLVLHSALFVPYHSWRITHSQHHKHTNHMTDDQVFVPSNRDHYNSSHGITVPQDGVRRYKAPLMEAIEETPLGDLFGIFQMLTFGWWAYLSANVSGQNYGKGANHFNPRAVMFADREYWNIVVSDLGFVSALATLFYSVYIFGVSAVLKYYFIPYMLVNGWLVLITYLQHSDPAIPHYAPKAFTFVRGALCSVDRDYGIYNILHHHIGDTHVVHHLFSQMPFYHAKEATQAVKSVLGEYYYKDTTTIFQALRRSWAYCKFVDEKDGEIMFYRNYKMEMLANEKRR
ncbi:Delta(12) fatty acid desaturase [Gracilariopsis chorda]|uniref:Delta(12) fatty acid desaturase n=1 Tax=Gracilariopsis chorda TaxID=448386 RepID=A0A2V3J0U3_9FLOR|nr:Delta(12) fatty acid desaturase [Gracilariopsis chorda]|eukprot:PXF47998.1 Delta(12) fatty acid desaturase [Gracilariopsis chorda]